MGRSHTILLIQQRNGRASVLNPGCCGAANLGECGFKCSPVLAIKQRHEPIPDKSFSLMHVIENSIAAAWYEVVTVLTNMVHGTMCKVQGTMCTVQGPMCIVQGPRDSNSRGGH